MTLMQFGFPDARLTGQLVRSEFAASVLAITKRFGKQMVLIRGKSLLLGCLLVGHGGIVEAGERQKSLRLAVWGGSHAAMLEHAVLAPFEATTDIRLQAKPRLDVDLDMKSNSADVVELELHEAIDACDNGELALLPGAEIGDFVPNALQPCALGQYVWSTVFAYDQRAFKSSDQPSLISDFFNVGHYPGGRAVHRSPRVISEWALLASGIPGADVYDVLNEPDLAWQIIERALESIKHSIVWVDDDDQAIDLLRDGTVSFAMVGSDTLLRAVLAGANDLNPVWDGSVNQMSLWAIPANSAHPELAWQFLRYATSVDATRRFSSVSGYGPARFSSIEQMRTAYHRYLPSDRSNLGNVVWGNSGWWRGRGRSLDMHFGNWLSAQSVKSDS